MSFEVHAERSLHSSRSADSVLLTQLMSGSEDTYLKDIGTGELSMRTVLSAARSHGEYRHRLTLASPGVCPSLLGPPGSAGDLFVSVNIYGRIVSLFLYFDPNGSSIF
jgi:hypothetical protein